MTEARNYNNFLVDLVTKAMAGRRRILDFGAGCGTFALPMRERGHEVICLEPEPSLRRGLQSAGFSAHSSLAELSGAGLDGIYTLNVLEHIEDDRAVLSQMYDRLVGNGRLYIYVPAFQILYSAMDRRVGHVRRYRLKELVAKCRAAGFIVERAGYCDSIGFLATLAYMAVGRSDGSIGRRSLIFYDRFVFPLSRALDFLVGSLFGKNVWVIASRGPRE